MSETRTRSHRANTHDTPVFNVRQNALFLDFDGTLAPLQDDPDTVFLPPGGSDILQALARASGGALAIISGRDIRDLDRRIPGALWRIGGHGSDFCAPGRHPAAWAPPAPDALFHGAHQLCADTPGTRLEVKGPVLALHYRASPGAGPALAAALAELVADCPAYGLQAGKMVFELKPAAASKARAVERLMTLPPFAGRCPVMIGDDATDEDGMRAAIALGGWAIKVGEGQTSATTRLDDPARVWNWLEAQLP
ncbi:haloacid dehalogenase [Maricaulis sp. W15]|uniref:trehalose-phosphatase n=1 Tax=Maricaulis sp. W15 TaxID=1772333 RepID=UPI000949188C|nr:trehalose-phosphatase [Maricaulis sp. W15]OLF74127.1 haloacid dehalogenase [Maricaulis sp. W15]